MQQLEVFGHGNEKVKRWKLSYSSNFLRMNIRSPDLALYIDMIAQSDGLFTMVGHDDKREKLFFHVNPLDKSFKAIRDDSDYLSHDFLDAQARGALTELLKSEHMLMMLKKSIRLKVMKIDIAKKSPLDGTITTIIDDNDIPWRINFTKKLVEIKGESFNDSHRLPFRYNKLSGNFEYCVGFDGPNKPINKKIEWKCFFNGCPELNSILIDKLKSIRRL